MTCGRRPKAVGRHRCVVCLDKLAPIGERIERSRVRLAMVPESMRKARVPERFWPPGQRWCSGCQSFVDRDDVTGSRCKPCASAASHGAAIQKTFGLTPAQYDQLLRLQDGKCAICRNRPKKKRLAVDHDHGTGAVRGLLCANCNHDALGALHDSPELAWRAYVYLTSPPSSLL